MGQGDDLKTTQDFIERAVENITKDRGVTHKLLADLITVMNQSSDDLKECGLIAAKYIETLQRSNEQLVKLATLKQKERKDATEFAGEEIDNIFDIIQGGESG